MKTCNFFLTFFLLISTGKNSLKFHSDLNKISSSFFTWKSENKVLSANTGLRFNLEGNYKQVAYGSHSKVCHKANKAETVNSMSHIFPSDVFIVII